MTFFLLGKEEKKMAPRKQKRFVERNVKVTKQEKKVQTVKGARYLKLFISSVPVSPDIGESPNPIKMKVKIFIHIDNKGSLQNKSRLMASVSRA